MQGLPHAPQRKHPGDAVRAVGHRPGDRVAAAALAGEAAPYVGPGTLDDFGDGIAKWAGPDEAAMRMVSLDSIRRQFSRRHQRGL